MKIGEICVISFIFNIMFHIDAPLLLILDVRTSELTGWGEWAIGQLTDSADWFRLR